MSKRTEIMEHLKVQDRYIYISFSEVLHFLNLWQYKLHVPMEGLQGPLPSRSLLRISDISVIHITSL